MRLRLSGFPGAESERRALPLAPGARQGCVARCAPVLRPPLPRAGFAVPGGHGPSRRRREGVVPSPPCLADPERRTEQCTDRMRGTKG
jgi:hypothetical protein